MTETPTQDVMCECGHAWFKHEDDGGCLPFPPDDCKCRQRSTDVLLSALTAQASELSALRADKSRLDWIDATRPFVNHLNGAGGFRFAVAKRYGEAVGFTIREALDAARKPPVGECNFPGCECPGETPVCDDAPEKPLVFNYPPRPAARSSRESTPNHPEIPESSPHA